MDGLRLGISFSYMPNSLRFCGPQRAHQDFLSYINSPSKKTAAAVESDVKRFEGLFTYLDAIAAKSKKHFTDYEVVEAYWIGNSLLDKFTSNDVKAIIKALIRRGLPAEIAENKIRSLPKGVFPHHNFNVCYVGVGRITGAVPTTIQNMNDCMTIPGIVTAIKRKRGKLVVRRKFLQMSEPGLQLGPEMEVEVAYLPQLMTNVKIGDVVAIHWGFAPMILTKRQQQNLEGYTQKVLAAISR